MPKLPEGIELDLEALYGVAVEKPNMQKVASSSRLKFSKENQRFKKVAFDLYRDSETDFIWRLEKDSETGEEYIVRTANKDNLYKSANHWTTAVDSKRTTIALAYKGHSLKAFKKAELEFDESNIDEWRSFLVDKIATDPTFLKKILASISEDRRNYIVSKFPELLN